jgi:hypothetical protein
MKMRSAAAALLLALFGMGTTHSAASGVMNPRAFALRLADMPVGFTQSASLARSTAQAEKADHLAKGTLVRHGRLAGYETEFKRSALLGMLDAKDTVLAYSSSTGAKWQMMYSMREAKTPYQGHRFHPMSVGRIGDQATGYAVTERTGGLKIALYIVLFRRGSYAVAVATAGAAATFFPEEAVHLAHVIEGHIRSGA